METLIKCSCGRNELPIHIFKSGCHHVECDFCRKESDGMESLELAIQAWNNMMREEYLKVDYVKHPKDELYGQHFKTKQVGGDHYSKHKIQPWDIIDEYQLNFYEGNILKYLLRRKNERTEDIRKLIHYAEKLIKNMEEEK